MASRRSEARLDPSSSSAACAGERDGHTFCTKCDELCSDADLDRSRADGETAAGAPGDEGIDLRRGGALLEQRSSCRGTSGELRSGTI